MRLSVLGMGSMGRAFAAHALEKGHHVTVWNRSPDRAGDLVAAGADEVGSPGQAVANCEAVLIVLADDDAVLEVCLGDGGLAGSLPPSGVVVVVSTVDPDTVRRLADEGLSERVVDAPVMGSPDMIRAGAGSFLVGGTEATVGALVPLWSDLGAGFTHCGPLGAGATMKIISNLLLITGVSAVAEAVATARRHGIPDDLLKNTLGQSFVVSPASQVRLDSLFDGAHPGWFGPELARKDVRLAVALAERAGVGVRIGPATDALLSDVIDGGRQWPDFTAVIEALQAD